MILENVWCPKCGRFCYHHTKYCAGKYLEVLNNGATIARNECLIRRCSFCGYESPQPCNDAEK